VKKTVVNAGVECGEMRKKRCPAGELKKITGNQKKKGEEWGVGNGDLDLLREDKVV